MRSENDIIESKQWRICGQWLGFENIKSRPAAGQHLLIDDIGWCQHKGYMNRFRERLREGEVVFGQMALKFTPGIGPSLAAAGMELVIFDMEHGRSGISFLAEMIASCPAARSFPWFASRISVLLLSLECPTSGRSASWFHVSKR
jgi:hypothetical protein